MKHRIAVIGYGYMGQRHGRETQESALFELSGIYDVDKARETLARSEGIRVFSTVEEVLEDRGTDVVLIATPNHLHCDLACRCLAAGKHVICEKPAALNAGELRRMLSVARRAGTLLSAHHNRRWDVDFLAVQSVVQERRLGKLIDLESRVQGSRGIPKGWRSLPECGGGILYDWGPHLIDQILTLRPRVRVKSVFCQFDSITTASVDDGFHLSLSFCDGVRAYLEAATHNFISLPRFYVRGTLGSAVIENWRKPCRVVECAEWDAPFPENVGPSRTMWPRDADTLKTQTLKIPAVDRYAFYRNFCAAIEGREESAVSEEDLLRLTEVMDAAFASGKSGKAVLLE